MKKIRCDDCNKYLAKITEDEIEIKCPRCKKINKEQIIEAPEAQKKEVSGSEKIRIL